MSEKTRVRGNPVPLIIEEHPDDYTGYPFITLIQYRSQHLLTIVDNATDKSINLFVLDLCGPAAVDEEVVIEAAVNWFKHRKDKYPISFEFSLLGLSNDVSKIYRTFNIEFVTRVIGPLPKFEMEETQSVKRRRRKPVPNGVQVHQKLLT